MAGSFTFNSQHQYYSIDFNGYADRTFDAIYKDGFYYLLGTDTNISNTKTYYAAAKIDVRSALLSLDSGFGTTYFSPTRPIGLMENIIDGGSDKMEIHGAAVDSLGRIITAGTISSASIDKSTFVVARYLANGTLDPNFGIGGKVEITNFGGRSEIGWSVIIQPDVLDPKNALKDKYLIGGTVNDSSVGVFRVTQNGSNDLGFKKIYLPDQAIYSSNSFMVAFAASGVEGAGNVLISGSGNENGQKVFRTYLYDPNGNLVTQNFGNSTGKSITNFDSTSEDRATVVKLYNPSSYLIGGTILSVDGGTGFGIVRQTNNGTLDTSWSTNLNSFQVREYFEPGSKNTFVDLAVQKDGKVVVLGYQTDAKGNNDILLVRYTSAGIIDQTFGIGGKVKIDTEQSVTPTDLKLRDYFHQAVTYPNKVDEILVGATISNPDTRSDFAVFIRDQNGGLIVGPKVPSYSLGVSSVSVNEGSTVIFTLTTDLVPLGETVSYTLSGISAQDVEGGSLNGTATVVFDNSIPNNNYFYPYGKATISVRLLADGLAEGAETLTLTAAGKTVSTIVNDTTISMPTYMLTASSGSVNEGSTASFTLSTTSVAAGSQVAYVLSGVSAADVQGGALTGTATVGTNGQATISVALVADTLTEGAETLTVTAGGKTASTTVNDTSRGVEPSRQYGSSGDDTWYLRLDTNYSLDLLSGSDAANYKTTRSSVIVTYDNGIITVGKSNFIDTLRNVERIDFTDGALIFDVVSSKAPAAYRLYGGAFDRTPDEDGFRFWASTLDKNVSLRDVATQFIRSPEFIARYGASLSNAAFVDALYQNVLDRSGDAGGVAYWNKMLDNKLQDRSDVLVQFTQLPEFVGISAANISNGYWVL